MAKYGSFKYSQKKYGIQNPPVPPVPPAPMRRPPDQTGYNQYFEDFTAALYQNRFGRSNAGVGSETLPGETAVSNKIIPQ